MQAPPPAGWTDKAPPPVTTPGGGATLDEELIALVSGTSAPATPNPNAKTKAAPPHNAAAVLTLRFVTIPNCSSPSRDAHRDTERHGLCLKNVMGSALVRPDDSLAAGPFVYALPPWATPGPGRVGLC